MPDLHIGVIGGTGLEQGLSAGVGLRGVQSSVPDTPFGPPSAPLVTGTCGAVTLTLLARHGPGHLLRPAAVPSRANVYALKEAGCTHLVAFGATGSLRDGIAPGDLVVCDQLIDRTEGRPRTFFEGAAVHVEFADPFCPVMRRWLIAAAARLDGVPVHDGGCYVCMEGPSFSTRAESRMHRQWGADVVGMTALPEARLAREAEIAYAFVAMPTDYDCWRPRTRASGEDLLGEIMANLKKTTASAMALLSEALRDPAILRQQPSPAHDALKLAIWSDKASLDPMEVERLRVLWGRYLGS